MRERKRGREGDRETEKVREKERDIERQRETERVYVPRRWRGESKRVYGGRY